MANKVWFITGCSRGFGHIWAEAALARGDKVVATAPDVKALAPLVERFGDKVAPLALNVRDRNAVLATMAEAHRRFERIDVVVNNARYGLFGTIEELSEAQARDQIETNLFGILWVTQAVLPPQAPKVDQRLEQVIFSAFGAASRPDDHPPHALPCLT